MRRSLFVLLCVIVFFVSGCVKTAPGASACRAQCMKQQIVCSQQCENNCTNCAVSADMRTKQHYQQFVHQQYVQGGLIARELNSYRDPLQCRKTTCDCQADYDLCREACSGIIHKRLQSTKTCC